MRPNHRKWENPFVTIYGTTCYAFPMKNKALRVRAKGAPAIVNGTTPPRRVANVTVRPREYLTAEEVDLLMKVAAKGKECGHRDATMILVAYRHGLRVGELVSVRWDQLDFRQGTFHVRRLKSGRASVHYVRGTELRALRRLQQYLTAEEVDLLMKVAAKGKECGHRDATMILVAYRHGLRVGELVSVRWDQLDFRQGTFHVRRLKSGRASVHYVRGTELRALRRLQ